MALLLHWLGNVRQSAISAHINEVSRDMIVIDVVNAITPLIIDQFVRNITYGLVVTLSRSSSIVLKGRNFTYGLVVSNLDGYLLQRIILRRGILDRKVNSLVKCPMHILVTRSKSTLVLGHCPFFGKLAVLIFELAGE
jgi:hypothetical protein